MGGMGSGRRSSYCGRDTTEDSLPLDIRKLQRTGGVTPGRAISWQWSVNDKAVASIRVKVEVGRVVLSYRHRSRGESEWQNVEQPVYMEHTPCTFGGTRAWWFCPSCGRRVAVLYGCGKHYACRHCYKLAYTSQGESVDDRAARRANRIRKKLGWELGILNGNGDKPKGMRWKTYWRLCAEHDACVGVSLAAMARWINILKERLE
jgi:hypothetical protein